MPSSPFLEIHIKPFPTTHIAAIAQVVLCQNIYLKEIVILRGKEGLTVLIPEKLVKECGNPGAREILEEVIRGIEEELGEVVFLEYAK